MLAYTDAAVRRDGVDGKTLAMLELELDLDLPHDVAEHARRKLHVRDIVIEAAARGDKGDGEWEEAEEAGESVGLAGSELLDYEARLLWISAAMYSR